MAVEILAVDDKRYLADILKVVLEAEGYKVVPAHSGGECLEKLKKMKPSLILLDIMMPGMNGWQTLEAIKKDERTKSIPVIMLTAVEEKPDEAALRARGAEDYIIKPFVQEDLVKRVKRVLGK